MTFDEASIAGKGHTNGFDYLRIGLSLSVLAIHCVQLSEGGLFKFLWNSSFGPLMSVILPAFFALSGYLVCGSLFRNSIPQFMTLRIIRIFPALTVEIVLTALIIGPIFTVLPLSDYFSSPGFYEYLLNALGIIHYQLPGVFEGRPPNMQLWTVPFELECYIVLVGLALFRIPWKPVLFLIATSIFLLSYGAVFFYQDMYEGGQNVPGKVLVLCFLCGCLMYLFKKRMPFSPVIALGCLCVAYVCLLIPRLTPFCAPAVAYATIYIGLQRLPPIRFGDLSYGIFLFHSPVAVTLDETLGERLPVALLIVLTTVITGLFAAASWRLIEEPILGSKAMIIKAVDRVVDPLMAAIHRTVPITARLAPTLRADGS